MSREGSGDEVPLERVAKQLGGSGSGDEAETQTCAVCDGSISPGQQGTHVRFSFRTMDKQCFNASQCRQRLLAARLELEIVDCLPNKRLTTPAGLICPLRKAFRDSAVARRRAGDTRERNYVLSLVAEQCGHDGGRGQAEMVTHSQEDIQRTVRQLAAHRRVGALGDRTERECWREVHHREEVLLD